MASNAVLKTYTVLASALVAAALPVAAEPRDPAASQYTSFRTASAYSTLSSNAVPRLNPRASQDTWRGPVTKTGSASLPDYRPRIAFSYPGSVSKPSAVSATTDAAARPGFGRNRSMAYPSSELRPLVGGARLVAAHRSLPVGSLVHVIENGSRKETVVQITSNSVRGGSDMLVLSAEAAGYLGVTSAGRQVTWQYIGADTGTHKPVVQSVAYQPAAQTNRRVFERPAPAAPKPQRAKSTLYVQIGSFTNVDYARTAAGKTGGGFDIDIQAANVKGRTWHRVMVGPFKSEKAAERARNKLAKRGFKDGFVVKS